MGKQNISPPTATLMRLLPETMRPHPNAIDHHVITAVENGWQINKLAAAAMVNTKGNIAFLVTNIKNLSQYPPVSQSRNPPPHQACDDHTHDPGCIVCKCDPNETRHFVPTPMPVELFAKYRRILGRR